MAKIILTRRTLSNQQTRVNWHQNYLTKKIQDYSLIFGLGLFSTLFISPLFRKPARFIKVVTNVFEQGLLSNMLTAFKK